MAQFLIPLFSVLLLSPSLLAQRSIPVVGVVVTNVGPQTVSEALVKAHIRVKQGDLYSWVSVDEDIKNLYATGYFYDIRVREDRTADGVTLFYYLQGKPTLTEIRFEGNKVLSDRKLKKIVTTKVGEPLDERKLFTDSQEIQKRYEKKGQPKTEVKYVPDVDEEVGRAVVTFSITETPKIKIKKVYFAGAEAFNQRKLRWQVKTRRRWMFSWLTGSGVVKEEQLEDDKEILAEFYRSKGYVDFELKEVNFLNQSPGKVVVQFMIEEGQRYRVGAIDLSGVSLFTTNQVREVLRMRVGEIFTPQGLRDDLQKIQDLYGTRGYIDTRVFARKKANTLTGTMDLVYELEEGERAMIEKIEIKGNTKTKDRVIRRELAVSPGEVFDTVRVRLSKQRIEGLQLFERVETQPEPTDIPNRRDLVMSVVEKRTGNFTVGAGFSSVDSILGFAEITQGNFDVFKWKSPFFTGGGQKFRLRMQLGAERQDYLTTFIEPWFLGKKLQFSTDLYHRELNNVSVDDVYGERRTGARFGLTKALGSDFLIGGVSYTLEDVGIVNVDDDASQSIQDEEGHRLVSKVGLSLSFDTRNNSLLPDRGQRSEVRTEVAGGPFGAETDFYKLEFRHSRYLKGLMDGHILEFSGKIGVVERYGNSERVPLFDRWFLGGIYDMRGYRYREVGPRDEQNEPLGGNTYWYATAEYSFPVIPSTDDKPSVLRFAVFYDIGMVYQDAYSFNQKKFKTGSYNDNWGIGLRINLPIGPLRLDYGIPIRSDRHNDSNGRFQFSVGYTREL